jgi:hypothetical protein
MKKIIKGGSFSVFKSESIRRGNREYSYDSVGGEY